MHFPTSKQCDFILQIWKLWSAWRIEGLEGRVGVETVNGTDQVCVIPPPCLSCDAYCIFASITKFIADSHWTCDQPMSTNGTFPEGTICQTTEECCSICDGGEAYTFKGADTSITCQNGVFTTTATCDASKIGISVFLFVVILFSL